MAYAERAYEDISGGKQPEGSAREVRYNIFEASSFDAALSALENDSATSEGPLVRSGFNSLTRMNDTTWTGTVSYVPYVGGLPDPSEFPGAPTGSFQFETGGGKRRIFTNLVTFQVANHPNGLAATPADVGRMINANEDGVEGLEIESSVFRFSVSKAWTPTDLPPGYVAMLYDYTNCFNHTQVNVNVDGIRLTFDAGELLFLGASGGRAEDGLWKISYNFAAQKNLPAGYVIGELNGFDEKVYGWSYLEVRTIAVDDPVPHRKPWRAIEHKVYDSRDLNLLGI